MNMKYIINRNLYLTEDNEEVINVDTKKYYKWLDTKKQGWDTEFTKHIMSFHSIVIEMVDELKDKFNDKDDPTEVKKIYLEFFEKSFEELVKSMRSITDENILHKLWNEFVLGIFLWKNSFREMGENIDNYNSIYKLGSEIFSILGKYTTKKVSRKYYDGLTGELDDMRNNSIDFIEQFYDEIVLRLVKLDEEEVFDMSNMDEKEIDELYLDPGDEVRYYKEDGDENIAIISHNQEELSDSDNNIRLLSKSDGTPFEINKSELIEIIPKNKTINQEVSDKLKNVKSDPEKLNKLNDYLGKLQRESMNNYDVTYKQTKRWISDPTFKRKHIQWMGNILRDVYKPIGHWKKYRFFGVMDLPWESNSWSLFNKINTNYSALEIMINEVNRALIQGKSKTQPFNFNDKEFGSTEFYNEYDRMMQFFDRYKQKIFLKLSESDGSNIINKVFNRIQGTTNAGDKAEKVVVDNLNKIIHGATDIYMPESGGESDDMIGGVDVTYMLNGIKHTIQVKKCKVFKNVGSYKVVGTSLSKHYNVDYLACVSGSFFYLFEYDKSKMELLYNGDIVVDESLLIKVIKV